MLHKIIIAGFGGQGILAAGKLIAHSAMMQDKHVSWLPSYGPEKRGGTSNCHIIISDEPVGAVYIDKPTVVIAMSSAAVDKFEPMLEKNGILIYDSSIGRDIEFRKDIKVISVAAIETAVELGLPKMANVMLVGKLLSTINFLSKEAVISAIPEILPKEKHHLIPNEIKILEMGMNYAS